MKRRCNAKVVVGLRQAATGLLVMMWMASAWAQKVIPFAVAARAETVAQAAVPQTVPLWIDVRTAQEYAQGHLPGAILIPYDQIGARIASVTTDKHAPIHLYCRSGRRSAIALQVLQQLGYRHVVNEGGYSDLMHKRK